MERSANRNKANSLNPNENHFVNEYDNICEI